MTVFTSLVFTQRHKVHSRSLLGIGAVVSVLLSIVSGFGFMFLCGVPFSPITQLLPFVMLGIGLDDSFVIMGAWLRDGNSHKGDNDPVERIRKTIDEVGLSITLTTITSVLAFALGCLSSIPGILWLCLYAIPTIIAIFIYQLTFFVACIVLDERRIQQNRRDCCICIVAATSPTVNAVKEHDQEHASPSRLNATTSKNERWSLETAASKAMGTYANWLVRPLVKVSCLIGFAALAAACAWSTSNMNQEFKFTDVLPQGSYATAYMDSYATYSSDVRVPLFIYFRNVNQSDASIQQQMQDYVARLGRLDQVQDKPDFFWLVDFLQFTNQASLSAGGIGSSSPLSVNSTFIDQLNAFLSIPMYSALHSAHLVRDVHDGSLLSSRCATFLTNFKADNVQSQIDLLYSQTSVTKTSQPTNSNYNNDEQEQEQEDWAFFNYSNLFDMWEFYSILVDELIATSLLGIAAVTIVTFVFIPQWNAALLVLPIVSVLYIDLLGVIQWAGVHINAVSYITLVMSIGLFVDYILHVLLRYYEATGSDRYEKTVEMLQTMGWSILLGGTSTLLGTLPLVWSTSAVFRTVFIAFLSFVTLGLAHGLILLPIILSMIG
jgi:Niemann-Pick C1 protein